MSVHEYCDEIIVEVLILDMTENDKMDMFFEKFADEKCIHDIQNEVKKLLFFRFICLDDTFERISNN